MENQRYFSTVFKCTHFHPNYEGCASKFSIYGRRARPSGGPYRAPSIMQGFLGGWAAQSSCALMNVTIENRLANRYASLKNTGTSTEACFVTMALPPSPFFLAPTLIDSGPVANPIYVYVQMRRSSGRMLNLGNQIFVRFCTFRSVRFSPVPNIWR